MYQDNFDSQELGITTVTFDFDGDCDMCAVLGWDCSACVAKAELAEANQDNNAHGLHEDDRLGENTRPEHLTSAPTASEWVASETIVGKAKVKTQISEVYDEVAGRFVFDLKFIQPTEDYELRHEFLEPIVQLTDRIIEVSDYSDYYEYESNEAVCNRCNLTFNMNLKECPTCVLADA